MDKDWRNLLLTEIKEVRTIVHAMSTEIELLKLKSGLWGFIAGAIPVIGLILLYVLKEKLFA